MIGLTLTDSTGAYHLENIPTGRYLVSAGPLKSLTYYPGTLSGGEATVVQVTASVSSGPLNFAVLLRRRSK